MKSWRKSLKLLTVYFQTHYPLEMNLGSLGLLKGLVNIITNSNMGWRANESHDRGIQEEFKVPSPILNSMYRPSYMKSTDEEISNDIEIWEINDKAQLVDNPKMCHFYINVTRNFTTTIQEYSKLLQNHILLTVVDNTEYSPSSTESTPISIDMTAENNQHIIKINSQLSFHGINQFLKYDTEVSTQYLQSLITVII